MNLVQQAADLVAYIEPSDEVDFLHPRVVETAQRLCLTSQVETVRQAYLFVRDSIAHSFDNCARDVPVAASEVLAAGHGTCFAKANLLAALLREVGIPAGFCYQRLTYREGFSLHGLNACYLASLNRWIRLDARGNRPGIDARFSTGVEILAYVPDREQGERDYPAIYPHPLPQVTAMLRASGHVEDLKVRLERLEVC